jgi:acyl-CoA synthetase (AMP-forming)/AMP-acid ligase II/acyl carrier protein
MQKFSTLIDLLQTRADRQARKVAYTFLTDGETDAVDLTFQQLDLQARAIAASLQSRTNFGDRALLLYPSGLDFIAAFLGCLYAGVVAVPAYPPRRNQSLSRLESIVTDAKATIALTTTSLFTNIRSRFHTKPELVSIDWLSTDNVVTQLAADWKRPDLNGNSLAFLQYTSGSTGSPKGVMVSHQNLLHNEKLIQIAFGNTEKSTYISWLPLFHDMGLIGNVLQSLYLGVPCVLMSPVSFLQKPIRWLQALSNYQATNSGAPNFAYDLCVNKTTLEQRKKLDLRNWQIAYNGAEPVRAETLERFVAAFAVSGFRRQALYPCYGMAETTLFVSGGLRTLSPVLRTVKVDALEQNKIITTDRDDENARTIVGCGQTFFDKIIIVEPESKIKLESDRVGEIWISGLSVAKGYWNRPEATQEVFKAYLDTGEGPFLRTGDLGFIQGGELFVTGRLKDVIIIRGRNYYPQDLELTAEKSHPALRENSSAAFSIESEAEEKLFVAVEVKRTYLRKLDIESTVAAIRSDIAEQFALQVHGVLLLKTTSIPKTSSGKIQRQACKQGWSEKSVNTVGIWLSEDSQPNSNRTEPKLTVSQSRQPEISLKKYTAKSIQNWIVGWLVREMKLPRESIELDRSFINYGVDSVAAVELAQNLGDWLEMPLESTLAWDFPSIRVLSYHLVNLKSSSAKTQDLVQQQPDLTVHSKVEVRLQPDLETLSEFEIAKLLAQEIATIQHRK